MFKTHTVDSFLCSYKDNLYDLAKKHEKLLLADFGMLAMVSNSIYTILRFSVIFANINKTSDFYYFLSN